MGRKLTCPYCSDTHDGSWDEKYGTCGADECVAKAEARATQHAKTRKIVEDGRKALAKSDGREYRRRKDAVESLVRDDWA